MSLDLAPAVTTAPVAVGDPVLAVRDLVVGLPADRRHRPDDVPLVRGVDLAVHAGQSVGLVGESGSGKTLTALAVAGLLPWGVDVLRGTVDVSGRDVLALPRVTPAPT
ncbi:hypothetical protein CTKZ_16790 [Cellulomonas algicola]|uniref:ABC transporter domain-containing protein n=1 Tax=Cellulomonas algicola TaxID=2071633 RepID=A0A401UZK2_9CELL|nr:ATP-binding cassette domain-containing protein [Cellulomonas algicola]GCD20117.1 hypothetical protein CTKZ_16790 [Cellulomonas algicola]